jgi:chromosomal replication initiator protein
VTGIGAQSLKGGGRSYVFARPRHLAFFLMRDLLGMSTPQIGRIMDKDHTTVCHGIKRATELLETNQAFREWHGKVLEQLEQRRAA